MVEAMPKHAFALAAAFAAVVLAAGCSTASGTPDPATSANVVACRAMESYPKFTGNAGASKYVAFLGRQMTRAGTSTRLDNAIQTLRSDIEEYLIGAGTAAQLTRDARQLQAVCTSYGVSGPQ
jgi:hypothetical protein